MPDTDTYAAKDTMSELFVAKEIHGNETGIAWARSSEPGLKDNERQQFLYRSLSMGFGLEGVNSNTGFASRHRRRVGRVAVAVRHDHVRLDHGHAAEAGQERVRRLGAGDVVRRARRSRTSPGTSATARASPTRARRRARTTSGRRPATTSIRVAATDDLGHTTVTTQTVHVTV